MPSGLPIDVPTQSKYGGVQGIIKAWEEGWKGSPPYKQLEAQYKKGSWRVIEPAAWTRMTYVIDACETLVQRGEYNSLKAAAKLMDEKLSQLRTWKKLEAWIKEEFGSKTSKEHAASALQKGDDDASLAI